MNMDKSFHLPLLITTMGLCPWTQLGAPPPDLRYRLALRALAMVRPRSFGKSWIRRFRAMRREKSIRILSDINSVRGWFVVVRFQLVPRQHNRIASRDSAEE